MKWIWEAYLNKWDEEPIMMGSMHVTFFMGLILLMTF